MSSWTKSPSACASCQLGKRYKLSFGSTRKTSMNPLGKIHCGLWGLGPNNSTQGHKYYFVFIEDYACYTWIYPLKKK